MVTLAADSNLNYMTHLSFIENFHSSLDATASQKPSPALKLEQEILFYIPAVPGHASLRLLPTTF